MRLVRVTVLLFSLFVTILVIAGCDKERIVNSSQSVHDTQYIQLPPDTIFVTVTDTIFNNSSDTVRIVDTVNTSVTVHDTVHVTDTVVTVQHHYDTVVTVQHHYDTITTVQHHYDTVTVTVNQCQPNSITAASAMAVKTDPMVFDLISSEFDIDGGWVFYTSITQMEISKVSTNVYDIFSYVDYWTDDWSGYYPLEVYWRLTYTSGDPANASSWQMTDPPTAAHIGGVKLVNKSAQVQTNPR